MYRWLIFPRTWCLPTFTDNHSARWSKSNHFRCRFWGRLTVGLSQDAEYQLHHAPHLPHSHQLLWHSRKTNICAHSWGCCCYCDLILHTNRNTSFCKGLAPTPTWSVKYFVQMTRRWLAKDTLQHGGRCELLHGAGTGAAFVKLFPQVHEWKETFRKDEILKKEVKKESDSVWHQENMTGSYETDRWKIKKLRGASVWVSRHHLCQS